MKYFFVFILFLNSLYSMDLNNNSDKKKVLIVGDSHLVGPFGQKLDELIRKDFDTETYGVCGSVAGWFFNEKETKCGYFFKYLDSTSEKGLKAKTPDIKKIYEKIKPDFVIAEFGANYYYYEDTATLKDIDEFITFISSNSKCLFVSQPDSRKLRDKIEKINQITIKANNNRCLFFDSSKITHYPDEGGDGIHYSTTTLKPQAENWALKVYEKFSTELTKIDIDNEEED